MKKKHLLVNKSGTIIKESNLCKQCEQEPVHEDCGDFCSNECMEAWEDDAFVAHENNEQLVKALKGCIREMWKNTMGSKALDDALEIVRKIDPNFNPK